MSYSEKHSSPWGHITAHIMIEITAVVPKRGPMRLPKVQWISPKQLMGVISSHAPMGRFLAKENGKWVAVDNSTGEAWTEEFFQMRQAVRWLRSESGISDVVDR